MSSNTEVLFLFSSLILFSLRDYSNLLIYVLKFSKDFQNSYGSSCIFKEKSNYSFLNSFDILAIHPSPKRNKKYEPFISLINNSNFLPDRLKIHIFQETCHKESYSGICKAYDDMIKLEHADGKKQ